MKNYLKDNPNWLTQDDSYGIFYSLENFFGFFFQLGAIGLAMAVTMLLVGTLLVGFASVGDYLLDRLKTWVKPKEDEGEDTFN
jgi:hypothetical protein